MSAGIFRFKQFMVDQRHCAMKINTDGVLLGAVAKEHHPLSVLDIGAGTGVIALMLAQRYKQAHVDAVEIDARAAATATENFRQSPFADRMTLYAGTFESYAVKFPDRKYDLIVSNPPFYTNSLKSPVGLKNIAKHAGPDFFQKLIGTASAHLSPHGSLWLIFPADAADDITGIAVACGLAEISRISIKSYPDSRPHRIILQLGFNQAAPAGADEIIIYESENTYSERYRYLLRDFFLAF